MNKLISFVHLDFITVKPYFTAKNLLIFAAVAVFLTTMSGNIGAGMGVGIMLGTLFISYPFAVGEKSNMDVLYATLSINRKTVVAGRYLFAFSLNLCAVLMSMVLAAVGIIISGNFGLIMGTGEILLAGLLLAAVFIVIQALQLPFFFKMGYTKAKFFSLVPFVALMSGYLAFMSASKDNGFVSRIEEALERLTGGALIALVVPALFLVCYCSYRLSLLFYKKREF